MQNVDGLTYPEMVMKIEELTEALEAKRRTEMGSLIEEFLSKVKAYQYPDDELLAEIRKKLGGKPSKGGKKKAAGGVIQGWKAKVIYTNPGNPAQTWKGGTRGPKPEWLTKLFEGGMSADEMTRRFSVLAKKN